MKPPNNMVLICHILHVIIYKAKLPIPDSTCNSMHPNIPKDLFIGFRTWQFYVKDVIPTL